MAETTPGMIFVNELRYGKPAAAAWIMGNAQNPQLSGLVQFFGTPYEGVLVEVSMYNIIMDTLRFEWDPNKNEINKKKHGFSFEAAKEVFYV